MVLDSVLGLVGILLVIAGVGVGSRWVFDVAYTLLA